MNELVRYDAACRALAECKAVDEVKSWADKAAAMQAYGRMAKDKTLEIDAAEIRLRAERRLGELIGAQKSTVGLNAGVRVNGKRADGSAVVSDDHRPTLADAGISKDLSARAQKLAAVPAEQFEVEVAEWRGRVEAEGARVTARLEAAGEKALGKAAPVVKIDKRDERIAQLEELLEEARDAAAEAGALAQDLLAQVNGESDKRLEQMRAELRAVQATRDIALRENAELKRMVKSLQRRLGAAA